MRARLQIILLSTIFGYIMSCSNNPYPQGNSSGKVFYTSFTSPPKNLDPQYSYTMADLAFLKLAYDVKVTESTFWKGLLWSFTKTRIEEEIVHFNRVAYFKVINLYFD